jgi:hypothetical protein
MSSQIAADIEDATAVEQIVYEQLALEDEHNLKNSEAIRVKLKQVEDNMIRRQQKKATRRMAKNKEEVKQFIIRRLKSRLEKEKEVNARVASKRKVWQHHVFIPREPSRKRFSLNQSAIRGRVKSRAYLESRQVRKRYRCRSIQLAFLWLSIWIYSARIRRGRILMIFRRHKVKSIHQNLLLF